jgi:hypothetical protein
MSYQLRKAEPAQRATLPASYALSEEPPLLTEAIAPQRIKPSTPPPLVARLDLSRAKWQNKNALIYPIIYVSPDALPEPAVSDFYPQIIALAPPDLWAPMPAHIAQPSAVSTSAPLSLSSEPSSSAAASSATERLFAEYNQPRKHLSVAVPVLLFAVLLLFVATYFFTIR